MKNPKILAYYLPAFHRIPENDKWYGDNFTEWDNTRRAIKLFKGHNQPRVPFDYYDLSKLQTLKKQMKLARKYGVDGFIYYHYWFNPNGRMVLEKPAEMMREKLDIKEKVNYCFCWANQEWRKTWHEGRGTTSELLIDQLYGNSEDWNNHLKYLSSFFSDEMYIKVNNCPMFMILRPEDIPNYEEMIDYWNNWAKKNGYNGIYFIRMRNSHRFNDIDMSCNAIVDFEPNYTINTPYIHALRHVWRLKTFLFWHFSRWDWFIKFARNKVDYRAFNRSIRENYKTEKYEYYPSMFVDWDNSPRKGRRGTIFTHSNPTQFKKELEIYYRYAQENNKDYLFIFAWNEWGEGGYLEPDTKWNYKKLEAIKKVKEKHAK